MQGLKIPARSDQPQQIRGCTSSKSARAENQPSVKNPAEIPTETGLDLKTQSEVRLDRHIFLSIPVHKAYHLEDVEMQKLSF
ncbi:hypothetical protein V6N13_042826 [Hibiscus sabdariffa]